MLICFLKYLIRYELYNRKLVISFFSLTFELITQPSLLSKTYQNQMGYCLKSKLLQTAF